MPNPIGGAYPVPGDLGQRLKGTENAVAQLQRLMMRLPNEKPTGAVPMGTTRAQSFTPLQQNGPSSTLTADGWDIKSLWGEAPTVTQDGADSSRLRVADEGFYSFSVNYYLTWDAGSVPTIVDTGADYQGRVDDYPRWKDAPVGTDLTQHYTFGPIYLPANGWMDFGSTWQSSAVGYINYFAVDVTRVG